MKRLEYVFKLFWFITFVFCNPDNSVTNSSNSQKKNQIPIPFPEKHESENTPKDEVGISNNIENSFGDNAGNLSDNIVDSANLNSFKEKLSNARDELKKIDYKRPKDKQIYNFELKQTDKKGEDLAKKQKHPNILSQNQDRLSKEYINRVGTYFNIATGKFPCEFYLSYLYKNMEEQGEKEYFKNIMKYISPINFKSKLEEYLSGEYEVYKKLHESLGANELSLSKVPKVDEMEKKQIQNDFWAKNLRVSPIRVLKSLFGYIDSEDDYQIKFSEKNAYLLVCSAFNLNCKNTVHYKKLLEKSEGSRKKIVQDYYKDMLNNIFSIAIEKYLKEKSINSDLDTLYIPFIPLGTGAFANMCSDLGFGTKEEYTKGVYISALQSSLESFVVKIIEKIPDTKVVFNIFDQSSVLAYFYKKRSVNGNINWYETNNNAKKFKAKKGLNIIYNFGEGGDFCLKRNHINEYYKKNVLVVKPHAGDKDAKIYNGGGQDPSRERMIIGWANYAIIFPDILRLVETFWDDSQIHMVESIAAESQ